MWRGHRVRTREASSRLQRVRERVRQANALAEKAQSIRHRLPIILEQLKSCKFLTSLASLLRVLGMLYTQCHKLLFTLCVLLHVHTCVTVAGYNNVETHILSLILAGNGFALWAYSYAMDYIRTYM